MQRFSGFFDAEATEEPHLDHLRAAWFPQRHRAQRLVERADLTGALRVRGRQIVEIHPARRIDPLHLAAAFRCRARAGGINQQSSHDFRAHGQEVRAVLPVHVLRVHQPDERLVHQGRGIPAHARAFLADVLTSQAPQLVVDERRQALERLGIATPPRLEQRRDFRCRGGHHRAPIVVSA